MIPLLYKDRRTEGNTPVRQAQLVELHLLEVFKKICEDHGLYYWILGGTLIGALRHGGFIPWDDDLDVGILEEDYYKFLKFARQELPADVYLEVPSDNLRMENHITRLRDNYSWGLVRRQKNLLVNDHNGICIDIFPVRKCGRCNKLRRFSSTYGYYKRAHFGPVTIGGLAYKYILGLKTLALKVLFECSQFMAPARYYVLASWFLNDKMWWPIDWIYRPNMPRRTAVFENVEMPIPFEAEKVLEMQYGKWRELPPVEARVGYLTVALPQTPCFHPNAMQYGGKEND